MFIGKGSRITPTLVIDHFKFYYLAFSKCLSGSEMNLSYFHWLTYESSPSLSNHFRLLGTTSGIYLLNRIFSDIPYQKKQMRQDYVQSYRQTQTLLLGLVMQSSEELFAQNVGLFFISKTLLEKLKNTTATGTL